MHPYFYPKAAQRRPLRGPVSSTPPGRNASAPCLMQMTVATDSATALRQIVMQICGDALDFLRIEACEHGARIKVWLCASRVLVLQVMDTVLHVLPDAEIGRFSIRAGGAAAARKLM
ncbi:hypothetical protein H3H36_13850 [Duganella sp. FT3S]|uniref:Uncharacterized protein n=1 Tax=Rugamonas fusca TaxID=2758568 RepID=A0A7W2I7D1_9BURK|nr:hypothetical protein [Rugamonas fusca]MBA5606437.1 hypothetical protein [Rugamonas fusca]